MNISHADELNANFKVFENILNFFVFCLACSAYNVVMMQGFHIPHFES